MTSLFAVSLLSASADAKPPVRQGKPCPTVGAEVIKGRWVFTCTLKKGKKIWVRAPKPTPKQTWQVVAETVYSNSIKRMAPESAVGFDFRVSPSFPPAKASRIAEAVRQSYRPWQAIAPLPPDFPVLIMDEASREWYLDLSASFPGDPCGDYWWEMKQPDPTTSTGANCESYNHDWGYMAVLQGSLTWTRPPAMLAHEAVHLAQFSLLGPRATSTAECWLGEGMAEVYTGALGFLDRDGKFDSRLTGNYRRSSVGNMRILSPGGNVASAAYWLQVIRDTEDRTQEACWGTGLGYSLGYLVSEKLISDFGEQSLFDWLALTRASGDSDAAFATVFGIDQDAWYEQSAAPYVAQEAALILG